MHFFILCEKILGYLGRKMTSLREGKTTRCFFVYAFLVLRTIRFETLNLKHLPFN